jgi:hypothetical protein
MLESCRHEVTLSFDKEWQLFLRLVMLCLVSNPSLNGAVGTVIRDIDSESRGRYGVNVKNPPAAVAAHLSVMSLKPINLMKVMGCARPGCVQSGTKGCSACSTESYCSADCQKADWKSHKPFCLLIKRMPNVLMSFRGVNLTIKDVLHQTEAQMAKIGTLRFIRLVQHAAAFAENQLGHRIEGTSCYSRKWSDSVDAWSAEIDML